MFAVVNSHRWAANDLGGAYSETIRVWAEGFYVQDPTVLLPKPFGSYRNLLINGNFDIWQRGNTFGTITDGGPADVGTLTNTLAKINVVKTSH